MYKQINFGRYCGINSMHKKAGIANMRLEIEYAKSKLLYKYIFVVNKYIFIFSY